MDKIKQNRVLIRKIIIISTIVLALVALVVGSYIATYNRNNITTDNAFEVTEAQKVSNEDFLNNFDSFEVFVKNGNYTEPYTKEDGTVVSGHLQISFSYDLKGKNNIDADASILAKGFVGADWINYRSNESTERSLTEGDSSSNYIYITDISKIFPVKTNMWFVTVNEPSVFIMISFTNASGQSCYTVFEYKLSDLVK